jgi:hypothetical protein
VEVGFRVDGPALAVLAGGGLPRTWRWWILCPTRIRTGRLGR